ncbi:hypothetical protein B0H11DRAFT_2415429 [Mycena galericulata]|nr:hypothetical protein B0H11DRAFT_2415429 [Mycena galericulata]
MSTLRDTCVALLNHPLSSSDIVPALAGFSLHPRLAEPLREVIPALKYLLYAAAELRAAAQPLFDYDHVDFHLVTILGVPRDEVEAAWGRLKQKVMAAMKGIEDAWASSMVSVASLVRVETNSTHEALPLHSSSSSPHTSTRYRPSTHSVGSTGLSTLRREFPSRQAGRAVEEFHDRSTISRVDTSAGHTAPGNASTRRCRTSQSAGEGLDIANESGKIDDVSTELKDFGHKEGRVRQKLSKDSREGRTDADMFAPPEAITALSQLPDSCTKSHAMAKLHHPHVDVCVACAPHAITVAERAKAHSADEMSARVALEQPLLFAEIPVVSLKSPVDRAPIMRGADHDLPRICRNSGLRKVSRNKRGVGENHARLEPKPVSSSAVNERARRLDLESHNTSSVYESNYSTKPKNPLGRQPQTAAASVASLAEGVRVAEAVACAACPPEVEDAQTACTKSSAMEPGGREEKKGKSVHSSEDSRANGRTFVVFKSSFSKLKSSVFISNVDVLHSDSVCKIKMDIKERRALTNSPYPTRMHSSEHPEAVPSATCAAALLRLDGVDLVAGEAFVPTRLQQDLTKVGSVYGPPAEAGRRKKKVDESGKESRKDDALKTFSSIGQDRPLSVSASEGAMHPAIRTEDSGAPMELQGEHDVDTRADVDEAGAEPGGLEGRPVELSEDSQGKVPLTSKESLFSPAPSIPAPARARGWVNAEAVRGFHSDSSATDTAATVRSRKTGAARHGTCSLEAEGLEEKKVKSAHSSEDSRTNERTLGIFTSPFSMLKSSAFAANVDALDSDSHTARVLSPEYHEAVPSATRATHATALLGLDGVDLAADETFVPICLQQDATSVGSVYGPLAEAEGRKKKGDELRKDASKCEARTSEAASVSLPAKILTRTYLSNVERACVVHSKSSTMEFGELEEKREKSAESSTNLHTKGACTFETCRSIGKGRPVPISTSEDAVHAAGAPMNHHDADTYIAVDASAVSGSERSERDIDTCSDVDVPGVETGGLKEQEDESWKDASRNDAHTFGAHASRGSNGLAFAPKFPAFGSNLDSPALRSNILLAEFASKVFALVSAIIRTFTSLYLGTLSLVGEGTPYRAWEREGIGTGSSSFEAAGAGAREHI